MADTPDAIEDSGQPSKNQDQARNPTWLYRWLLLPGREPSGIKLASGPSCHYQNRNGKKNFEQAGTPDLSDRLFSLGAYSVPDLGQQPTEISSQSLPRRFAHWLRLLFDAHDPFAKRSHNFRSAATAKENQSDGQNHEPMKKVLNSALSGCAISLIFPPAHASP